MQVTAHQEALVERLQTPALPGTGQADIHKVQVVSQADMLSREQPW